MRKEIVFNQYSEMAQIKKTDDDISIIEIVTKSERMIVSIPQNDICANQLIC